MSIIPWGKGLKLFRNLTYFIILVITILVILECK